MRRSAASAGCSCLGKPSRPSRCSRRVCWCLFSCLLARIDMIVGPPPPSTPRHKKYPTKGPTAPPRESPQYSPRSGRQPSPACVCGMASPLRSRPHDGRPVLFRGVEGRFSAADRHTRGQATLCRARGGCAGRLLSAGPWGSSPRMPCVTSSWGRAPWAEAEARIGCPDVQGGPSGLRGPWCPCHPAPSATQTPAPAHPRG